MTSLSESEFELLVDGLKSTPDGRAQLTELLDERHPVYAQRAATAIVRMRGWILLALGELGITDRELVYVLEELDAGREPYLVAVAARALRSYAGAHAGLGAYLGRAQENIRFRDDALRLDRYGGYADAQPFTTAMQELEATQRLLAARPEPASCCCGSGADLGKSATNKPADGALQSARFQDHNGTALGFADYFVGRPSIVVFFYTRCTNPQKCSLTMTKLGRIGVALRERGLDADIRTAAITYDPEFDDPDRLRRYAESRSVLLGENHRVLRPMSHLDELREYFENGVSFVGSIVNRHRIELYVLDGQGRIAATFHRVLWDENEVIEEAVRLIRQPQDPDPPPPPDQQVHESSRSTLATPASAVVGTAFSIATAFFPKCPMCWAAYLSAFGVASLESIEYSPWLLPVFMALMAVNLASLYPRRGARRQRVAFGMALAGAIAILVPGFMFENATASILGVVLTAAGSFLAVGLRDPEARVSRRLAA